MIIRVTDIAALPDDELQALGEAFVRESKHPGSFKVGVFKRNWSSLIGMDMGAIWVIREDRLIGAFGAILHPDINDDEPMAQEAFWFVAPEHRGGMAGIRLLGAFEAWAAQRGAKRLFVAHLIASMPEKVRKLFEHRGYSPAETVHIKVI